MTNLQDASLQGAKKISIPFATFVESLFSDRRLSLLVKLSAELMVVIVTVMLMISTNNGYLTIAAHLAMRHCCYRERIDVWPFQYVLYGVSQQTMSQASDCYICPTQVRGNSRKSHSILMWKPLTCQYLMVTSLQFQQMKGLVAAMSKREMTVMDPFI